MPYPSRVIYNGSERTEVAVTNEWVLGKPNTLSISSDKSQIAGDGVDTATLTIQLKTPMLIDDSYDNVAQAGNVSILIDDEEATVTLDSNGTGTQQITSIETGSFVVCGSSLYCPNPITIEVV